MTDNRKIIIKNARLQYPRLFTAEVNKMNPQGKPAYSTKVVLTDDHPQLKELKELCAAMAVQKFGEARAPKIMKEAKDSKNTRGLHYDEDQHLVAFNAKRNENRGRPLVFDRRLDEITKEGDGPQGGDWVNVAVAPYWYDNQSRGLSFELLSVQFVKKGEPFPGEGVSSSKDDFEALADDAGESKPLADDAGESKPLTEEQLDALI